MGETQKAIKRIEVEEELSVCPGCGSANGFHVSFVRKSSREKFKLVLICPHCRDRYDIQREI